MRSTSDGAPTGGRSAQHVFRARNEHTHRGQHSTRIHGARPLPLVVQSSSPRSEGHAATAALSSISKPQRRRALPRRTAVGVLGVPRLSCVRNASREVQTNRRVRRLVTASTPIRRLHVNGIRRPVTWTREVAMIGAGPQRRGPAPPVPVEPAQVLVAQQVDPPRPDFQVASPCVYADVYHGGCSRRNSKQDQHRGGHRTDNGGALPSASSARREPALHSGIVRQTHRRVTTQRIPLGAGRPKHERRYLAAAAISAGMPRWSAASDRSSEEYWPACPT